MEINNELTEWIKGAAEKGGAFLETEAPKFVEEVLAWEFWGSIILAGCAVIFVLLFVALAIFAACTEAPGELTMTLVCLALLSGIPVACGVNKAIKCKVAPRVVIVEKVKGLLP